MIKKREQYIRRTKRARVKIFGTATRPRMSVMRSNTKISVQLFDDEKGVTLASASQKDLKGAGKLKRVEIAQAVGKEIGKKAVAMKIDKAVFDRGGNRYHGRIKALADAARKQGMNF